MGIKSVTLNTLDKRSSYPAVKEIRLPGTTEQESNWIIIYEAQFYIISEGFSFIEKIPAPTFQFGGQIGSRETSLVFRRKSWHRL